MCFAQTSREEDKVIKIIKEALWDYFPQACQNLFYVIVILLFIAFLHFQHRWAAKRLLPPPTTAAQNHK